MSEEFKDLPKSEQILERDADFNKTTEQITAEEIELSRAEARENYDKYLRALAELENFKKRSTKERSDLLKYQGEKIISDLLEVVDDLERAIQHADSDPQHLKSGVEMIYKRFVDVLAKWEVKGESAIGKQFNPAYHSAISKVPTSGSTQPGTVVGELKKVYSYKDKILRFGQVVVADGASEDIKSNSSGNNE